MNVHEPILCWLHISDLHIKDENGTGRLEISHIVEDLKTRSTWYRDPLEEEVFGPPDPRYIFVTGDVGRSGDIGLGEYKGAKRFLNELCETLEIGLENVFVVPGNHDLHRDALPDDLLKTLASAQDVSVVDRLAERRFANFNEFANDCAVPKEKLGGGCWKHRLGTEDDQIQLVGLNTALVSATEKKLSAPTDTEYESDEGRLAVSPAVIDSLRKDGPDMPLTIVLMHHPESWLKDSLSLRLGPKTIWLHGHTHEPDGFRITRAGEDSITVVAGAVHLERGSMKGERVAYNIGAIFSDDDQYRIELWPRVLSLGKTKRFVLDAERTQFGLPYQSHKWQKVGDSTPSTQHKRFWSLAIPRALDANAPVDIWIAAHSNWYMFRPRDELESWDRQLFSSHTSFPDKLEDVNGDVWKPLARVLAGGLAINFRFRILLTHPFSAEAKCVRRNQDSELSEKGRNAQDDFYRTIRALQLISRWTKNNQPEIEKFDVRVLNPLYRVMTNSLYAVGDYILFVPLKYSGLVDQGFAIWHRDSSPYRRYLDFIKRHFDDNESLCSLNDPSKKFWSARAVPLDDLAHQYADLTSFRHAVEGKLSWLRERATREFFPQDTRSDRGTYSENWMKDS